jgi:hypothetical protein
MRFSRFDRDALPSLIPYLESDGVQLRPAGRGRLVGRCPEHESKSGRSFVVNRARELWFCFGCHRGGDLIAYVQWRKACTFPDACKAVDAWRGEITPADRARIEERRNRNREECARVEYAEACARAKRIALRNELHIDRAIFSDINSRLSEIGGGAQEVYDGEAEDCWSVLADVSDDLRLVEAEYEQACGLGEETA